MQYDTRPLSILDTDKWLRESAPAMEERYGRYISALRPIESAAGSIVDYANGYRWFGFQRDEAGQGWWYREWLPGARAVWLFGDFNDWNRRSVPLKRGDGGVWSVFLPDETYGNRLIHGTLVKILVESENGTQERIPAYIRRALQNENTKNFSGQFWNPAPFDWGGDDFNIGSLDQLLIYECHVGMAQEKEAVGTYSEFASKILPYIKKQGYNVIQLMGIAEHPYYGSFGYHVSNFFAPSSRFGTPEDLKALIKKAHSMGIGVVMDLVHSHYVKNLNEGLNQLDGTDHQYSPAGEAGSHPYWDSKLFDYGKQEVRHFLLSNVKYWLDEFHFDGFRFDGVTSMIYKDHGYRDFERREDYFGDNVNKDALTYLTLANKLVRDFRPSAVTIAEDVSGMPGMCAPVEDGGVGFTMRLGMSEPDFWIRMLKEVPDERWEIGDIWKIMTDRLPYVKTVAYCESHDQAMVGDKTLAFRLMDKEMYSSMTRSRQNLVVDRGMALHKMIRLATVSMGGQAYLNFMGNEFGHPDWIDFPRQGNGWSYTHARRQWSLAQDPMLRYGFLGLFDREMLKLVRKYHLLKDTYPYNLQMDHASKTMVYSHGDVVFVLNWHPTQSITDYSIKVPGPGRYRVVLSTDAEVFGGQGRHDATVKHFTFPSFDREGNREDRMLIYNVCRTAVVFKKI